MPCLLPDDRESASARNGGLRRRRCARRARSTRAASPGRRRRAPRARTPGCCRPRTRRRPRPPRRPRRPRAPRTVEHDRAERRVHEAERAEPGERDRGSPRRATTASKSSIADLARRPSGPARVADERRPRAGTRPARPIARPATHQGGRREVATCPEPTPSPPRNSSEAGDAGRRRRARRASPLLAPAVDDAEHVADREQQRADAERGDEQPDRLVERRQPERWARARSARTPRRRGGRPRRRPGRRRTGSAHSRRTPCQRARAPAAARARARPAAARARRRRTSSRT